MKRAMAIFIQKFVYSVNIVEFQILWVAYTLISVSVVGVYAYGDLP